MLIGYARTSTLDQIAGFVAQRKALQALGCEKLFEEQVSSVGQRDALSAALEFVREGDTLVVTKLDRLARSVRHLGEIVEAQGRCAAALPPLSTCPLPRSTGWRCKPASMRSAPCPKRPEPWRDLRSTAWAGWENCSCGGSSIWGAGPRSCF